MKRILLILVCLLAAMLAGGYFYLKSNMEMVSGVISKTVSTATGKPLVLETPRGMSIFPKFGLDVGKVRWGGDTDDMSVTCDQAVVRLDVLALLSGRVEVEEVVLDAPRLVYRQAARAQDKTESAPVSSGGAGGEPGVGKWAGLRLDAVRIKGGEVRVEQPDLNLQLSRLDLTLTDLAAGKSGTLQLAVRVALNAADKTPIEADVALKTGFVTQYPVVKVQNCALTLTPLQGLPVARPVSVTGNVDIDTAVLSLAQMDLAVDFAGSDLRVKGQASLPGRSGQFDLALKGALRETLAACGLALRTQDPKALGAVELTSRLKLSGSKAEVADLQGRLDETAVSGNLSASPAAVAGAINVGALNLDRYLPPPQTSEAGKAAATAGGAEQAKPQVSQADKPAAAPAYPDVRLELAVESLRAGNLRFDDLKALIQGKGGRYALDPCTFRFYESAVSLAARAQLAEGQYSLKTTANDVNAGALLKDAAKQDKVQGRLNLQADLSLRGKDEAAMRRGLDGTARLTGQINLGAGLLHLPMASSPLPALTVNKIDVTARADKGRIVLKPIASDGDVKVNGQGTADLPSDKLDARLDANVAGLPLPLVVSGTLKNPAYSLDTAGMLKNVLENPKAGQAVEKGLKGLMKRF